TSGATCLSPVAAFVITAPPYECPTARTRPGTCSSALLTYAASIEMPRNGFGMVVTGTLWFSRRSITPFQLELSANAPCTSATVRGCFLAAASDIVIHSFLRRHISLSPLGGAADLERSD